MKKQRPRKEIVMLRMAKEISKLSDCKSRSVGAIITDDNFYIIGTGYNGTISGSEHCDEKICARLTLSNCGNLQIGLESIDQMVGS